MHSAEGSKGGIRSRSSVCWWKSGGRGKAAMARNKRKKQGLSCRSINPFIYYYWKLERVLGRDYSSQVIAKIAARRWEFMDRLEKLRYVQQAKRQRIRRRRSALWKK
ncbi:hypothetical protein KM043_013153 [Ampulex compressa]|nr:hypothetical protein KM043_013153 [Ampulex compressa]